MNLSGKKKWWVISDITRENFDTKEDAEKYVDELLIVDSNDTIDIFYGEKLNRE